MKVINIGETDSVLNNIIAQIRDKAVQKDRMRFRFNLERLGHIFAYELSKSLEYSPKDIETPLATSTVSTCDTRLVIATILRAGLPLHRGLLDVFDSAESAFIAAYRKYDKGDDFHINIEYCTCPTLTGKTLILCFEQGEEEYDPAALAARNASVVCYDGEEDVGAFCLRSIEETRPDRIYVEMNTMMSGLRDRFPPCMRVASAVTWA